MRTLALAIMLFTSITGIADAQSVAGVYTTPTSNGAITLTLEQQAQSVSGTLVGDDGTTFRVQGTFQGGELSGTLANPTGTVASIHGGLYDAGVRFYVIPIDGNGQPNNAAAQEFVMSRQSGATAGPSGTSPLSGLAGGARQPGSDAPLAGSYAGNISGTPATLIIERNGASFLGSIDAGGYGYSLQGTASGSAGRGTLDDPQAGARMEIEIAEERGTVTVTILASDPNTGQVQRVPFEFRRGGGAVGGFAGGANEFGGGASGGHTGGAGAAAGYGSGAGAAAGYGSGAGAAGGYGSGGTAGHDASIQRDPALVGSWSHSDTYNSNSVVGGNFSATTRYFMQIGPDGSYAYGSRGMSAGLDNDLGSVSGSSGGGDVSRGQWRTQDGIVYIMEPGSPQWVPYAKYYVEGSSMMFTFGNGKKQLWYRR